MSIFSFTQSFLLLLILPFSSVMAQFGLPQQSSLKLVRLEAGKKEVLPGEGINMFVTVKNEGREKVIASKMYFTISDSDSIITTIHENDFERPLIELESDSKVDFNYLVTIPINYTHPYVYIKAYLAEEGLYTNAQHPPEQKFVGVKIADKATYKNGMYAQDLFINEIVSTQYLVRKKVPFQIKVPYGAKTSILLPGDQILNVFLSADKHLDEWDNLLYSQTITTPANGVIKTLPLELKLGEQYSKGKKYIFVKITSERFFDTDTSNNISKPIRIKLK